MTAPKSPGVIFLVAGRTGFSLARPPKRGAASVKTRNPPIPMAMPPKNSQPVNTYPTPSDFQQTCGYCGCVFRVEITWRTSYSYKADRDTQVYSCPECQRASTIKTSSVPQVTLISKRTDGRTGPCPPE